MSLLNTLGALNDGFRIIYLTSSAQVPNNAHWLCRSNKNTIGLTSFRSWSLRCLSLIVFCWSATFLLLFFLWRNPVRYSLYVNKGQTSTTATITNYFLFGKQHHDFIPSKEASYNLWGTEVGTYWRALSSNTATEFLFLRNRLPMWCPPRATSPSSSSISKYVTRIWWHLCTNNINSTTGV